MSIKRLLILLAILVFLCTGVVIYYLSYLEYDDSVDRGLVSINNTKTNIKITSPLSLNDETGRNITNNKNGVNVYYKVKLQNGNEKISKFKLLLDVSNVSNCIDNKYIKILVSDENDKLLNFYDRVSYPTLDSLPIFKGKIVLTDGKLRKNEKTEYILRLWASDFYVFNDDNQEFRANVEVYSY